jgi:hypothetical protein
MGGYTPFGFGGFSMPSLDPDEEERKRREQEAAEASRLRMAMNQDPNELPTEDVGGRLPDIEEPERKSTEGSIDDTAAVAGAAAEGDVDYITRFEEHLAKRPDREDYKPSTLRKILGVIGGTLAGGDPNVTRMLAGYGKYDDAMSDWAQEGEGLGEVAKLREAQAKERGLGTGREYTRETAKETHQRGVAGLGLESGRLKLGIDELAEKRRVAGVEEPLAERETEVKERGATTAEERADHYGRSVDAMADYRSRQPGPGTVSGSQQAQLEQLALEDVINMNPAWEKFARFQQSGAGEGNLLGRAGEVPVERDFWFDTAGPAADDPDYQEFMIALEAARRRRAATAGAAIPPLPGGVEPLGSH